MSRQRIQYCLRHRARDPVGEAARQVLPLQCSSRGCRSYAVGVLVGQSMRVQDRDALSTWPMSDPYHLQTGAVLSWTAGATDGSEGSIVATMIPWPPEAG